jgi:branched-chain amino acid transport system substrate-binding protein
MVRKQGRLFSGVVLVMASTLGVLGLVSTSAGAQASGDPGVTSDSIKVGYIWNETGVAATSFVGAGPGFQARIDRQNAEGGVNGRKIETEIVDDQSSGANLTAAQDLVENSKVFVVVNDSSFGFLSYRYLVGAGVPVIGGGFDGSYYSEPGNESIISVLGNVSANADLTSMIFANAMQKKGATKVAAMGYGVSASSTNVVKAVQKYAVPKAGMRAVYTNTSVDFGTADVSPIVLGIKKSGADAAFLPMAASTNLAIVQGLKQAGVQMKANIISTGYGQDLLDSPGAATLGPNDLFFLQTKPVQIRDNATKQFQADLKKYAGFTAVPSYGHYQGYLAADLLITGLQHAGKTPTRQGFVDGLRKLGTWDGAGLMCQPVDISLENYGKQPKQNCAYYSYVKDRKFVPAFGGKVIIGKLVGSPEALAENSKKGLPAPTTTATPTTAAP